tara:strand:+ start:468 stop:668 length:201 start_codon:yes stop_codon:yes gene_type:complete
MLLFIGGAEIFIILLFIVMFFGSSKIPEIAKSLGKAIREIKDASNDIKREISDSSSGIKKDLDLED